MNRLLAWVKEAERIALLPHVRADGDAIGSCYALAEILKSMGKAASVILEEEPLSRFCFLKGNYQIYQRSEQSYDLVIAVDCSDLSRLGERKALFRGKTVCIDHHITTQPIGLLCYVDPSAAATAELIYLFAKKVGVMNLSIAAGLYTALSTDSGGFRYSNTTPRTMRIGAELMELGLDTARINRLLYEQVTLGSLRFQAECIEKMQLFDHNRIAVTYLSMEREKQLELTPDDTEGGGSLMLSIKGVSVGVFFHEREPGIYKVSLRSDEKVDVACVASSFGGGGHLRASGYSASQPFEDAVKELILKLSKQLGDV